MKICDVYAYANGVAYHGDAWQGNNCHYAGADLAGPLKNHWHLTNLCSARPRYVRKACWCATYSTKVRAGAAVGGHHLI